jgi:hypothetical protein
MPVARVVGERAYETEHYVFISCPAIAIVSGSYSVLRRLRVIRVACPNSAGIPHGAGRTRHGAACGSIVVGASGKKVQATDSDSPADTLLLAGEVSPSSAQTETPRPAAGSSTTDGNFLQRITTFYSPGLERKPASDDPCAAACIAIVGSANIW